MIIRIPDKGDPSDQHQLFPQFDVQVLCCRYWWLKNWEFGELSYPYWRIYWNPVPGAEIIHNENIIKLEQNKLVIIAPNTSYAARLFDNQIPEQGFVLTGGRIHEETSRKDFLNNGVIPHLFIHFNIGMPYDNIHPQVFTLEITDHWLKKLRTITASLQSEFRKFDFHISLVIKSLIFDLLASLPDQKWEMISKDKRILNILQFIELNLKKDLSNNILADQAKLVTNAFIRLFKAEVGVSPQVYIREKRIAKACALLDHSRDTIDIVAEQTGFADRYHFSKIFKQVIGTSPGKYRKEFSV